MDGQDLGSAILEVERLTKAAERVAIIKDLPERHGVYLLAHRDGTVEHKLAEPGWHDDKLATPDELAAFIEAREDETPIVFYGPQKIVYQFDAEDRRDVATCDLRLSQEMQTLGGMNGRTLDQRAMVRTLRINFRTCLGDSNLLPLIRQLKFSTNDDAAGNLQHGQESLGRKIVQGVTGEGAIPEEFVLSVPVFENHNYRARVGCALEIFLTDRMFQITPYPGELARAMDEALADVARVLVARNGSLQAFRSA